MTYYQKNRKRLLAYQKEWRARNPDKVKEYYEKSNSNEYDKDYYQEAKDIYKKASYKWRKKNRKKYRAYLKKYYQKNKDRLRMKSKEWRLKNKERVKENHRIYMIKWRKNKKGL